MKTMPNEPAGLYFHIPFCLKKCPYCDFYSISDLSQTVGFLAALSREMLMNSGTPLVFDTIYIGGGTPSALAPAAIGEILDTTTKYFNIASGSEITIEVNPGTVTLDNLFEYRKSGVNRLNIGIQSFDDRNLRFLGRIHSGRDARSSLEWARQAGFDNIGLDLIFGLPGQDKPNWLGDLARAVNHEPEHLSCYMLTCESGTPLAGDVKTGRIRLAPEGTVADLFNSTIQFLAARSYLHYEVSNFAHLTGSPRKPQTSRHNLKYWTNAPYIGLGPSAHSYIEPVRYWNHRSLATYIRQLEAGKPAIAEKESLTKNQMMTEAIYLGLRTTLGIDLADFRRRFGLDFYKTFRETIEAFEKDELIERTQTHCRPTLKGMILIDAIAAEFTCSEL